MLKRGYCQTFHHLIVQHHRRYVYEFAGRQNIGDLDTIHQMPVIAQGIDRTLLRYSDLVG